MDRFTPEELAQLEEIYETVEPVAGYLADCVADFIDEREPLSSIEIHESFIETISNLKHDISVLEREAEKFRTLTAHEGEQW